MQKPNLSKAKRRFTTKRMALTGILLAAALILSLIESYIPPIISVAPYAKIGFANIVLIVALLILGYPEMFLIMILKCVFTGIFSGNMFSLAYSIPAGIVAYTVSAFLFRIPKLSIVAVSVISGILHNFIQCAVASGIIGKNMWLVCPYLLLIGAIAGLGVGIISFVLIKAMPQNLLMSFDIKEDTALQEDKNIVE